MGHDPRVTTNEPTNAAAALTRLGTLVQDRLDAEREYRRIHRTMLAVKVVVFGSIGAAAVIFWQPLLHLIDTVAGTAP